MALAFDLTLACSRSPLTSQETLLVTPRAVSHLIHNAQTTRDIQSQLQNITHQKWPDIKWLHFQAVHHTFSEAICMACPSPTLADVLVLRVYEYCES